MKNALIVGTLVVLLVLVTGAAYLPDSQVQVFAPNGKLTVTLTAPSTTRDMTKWKAYRVQSTVDCIRRHMPTSAKGSYPSVKVYADSPVQLGVSITTPFTNLSGCTGTLEGM